MNLVSYEAQTTGRMTPLGPNSPISEVLTSDSNNNLDNKLPQVTLIVKIWKSQIILRSSGACTPKQYTQISYGGICTMTIDLSYNKLPNKPNNLKNVGADKNQTASTKKPKFTKVT